MNKKLIKSLSFALALCLALSLGLTAYAETAGSVQPQRRRLEIGDAQQLLRFAEDCRLDYYSAYLDVELTADIDLSGTDFPGIPIFYGSFNGAGHCISGLEMSVEGSHQGFFRYIAQGAAVKNLRIEGIVSPGGSRSRVGGLAGSNAGLISNCTGALTVSGADMVGGLVGENTISGIIEKSRMDGTVSGSHFVGGLAGNNLGVIRDCRSYAMVNVTPDENSVELADITIDSITGAESTATVTDVGGIAGASQGMILSCENHGNVGYRLMGYNVGGIAGTQMGYIYSCRNFADICGRKEVGGIVGQMEPTAYIAFQKDALQILNSQLDGLSGLASQAASNAQMTAGTVGGQMNMLMGQITQTGMALGALGGENGLIDPDSYQAAQNVLSSGVAGMTQTMQGVAAATTTAMGQLSNDIQAMVGQINAMRATLGNISENMGGKIKDLSDDDTPDKLAGKVELCENTGSVSGDLNVGGITGAIAPENDLDVQEDYILGNDSSLNFVSELRAVILNCKNSGTVSSKRSCGGGVAGQMYLGLVKGSANTGTVNGGSGEHMGGIAGDSKGYLRSNSAKCVVSGADYVGGIAGEAGIVSDSRSMVVLSGDERVGAILGYGVQSTDDDGMPTLIGNVYLLHGEDMGGIDGVSYVGVAHALEHKDFFALPSLPDFFGNTKLSFVYDDGSVKTVELARNTALSENMLPEIPAKPGYVSFWDDVEYKEYEFDKQFKLHHIPASVTLETVQRGEGNHPLMLAEGSFLPGTQLYLRESAYSIVPPAGHELLVCARVELSDGSHAGTVRYYVGQQDKELRSYALHGDGMWYETECSSLGSYAVIDMPEGCDSFAIVRVNTTIGNYSIFTVAAAVLLFYLVLSLVVMGRHKKAKSKTPAV